MANRRRLAKRIGIALAALLGVFAVAVLLREVMNSRTFQFFGGIVNHVDTDEKVVALTFDDGPTERTDDVLAVLKTAGVKATFFLVGSSMHDRPEETKRIVEAGHQVGNHTWSHRRMVFLSLGTVAREIEQTDSEIRAAGYTGDIQFRPPNGKKLVLLPYYLKTHDRKTVLWDIEPNSYPEIDKSSDAIAQYVLEHVRPGSIILLHVMVDGKGTSLGAVPGIVEGLRAQGYTFVTINELLEYNKGQ